MTHRVFKGKCPRCGKIHYSDSKDAVVLCDCWRYCPICGAEMQHYKPDLAANTYGSDGKHDLNIIMVCNNHSPPFYSSQKPVQVRFDA